MKIMKKKTIKSILNDTTEQERLRNIVIFNKCKWCYYKNYSQSNSN